MDTPLIIPATSVEVDKIRGYRIGHWHDYKNYECIYCQYSTLWLSKMDKHQADNVHPWAYPGQNTTRPGEVEDSEPDYG